MRNVHVGFENPRGSMFYKAPPVLAMIEKFHLVKIPSWLGAFGSQSPKPVTLYVSHDADIARRLLGASKPSSEYSTRNGDASVQLAVETPIRKRKRSTDAESPREQNGWKKGSWVSGTGALTASKFYPYRFCVAVANLARASVEAEQAGR